MPEPPELQLRALLAAFTEAAADFVIIGGVAVNLHGYGRMTKDLDIIYDPAPENLERLGGVLTGLRAKLFGIDEDLPFVADARTLRGTEMLTADTDLGRVDLLRHPEGAPDYAAVRAASESFDWDGLVLRVVSLDHLLAMKRAAGRPQDLLDITALERARELSEEC